jgi:hypothetical protein
MRTDFLPEALKEGGRAEELGVYGRIILKRILGTQLGRFGLNSSATEQGPVDGSNQHFNGPSGSIKGGEFLD